MSIPPEGMGNAYFVPNWSMSIIVIPYLFYFFSFVHRPPISWILFVFSCAMVCLYTYLVEGFKQAMFHISNSRDFVIIEFINLANIVVYFGLSYFYLSKISPNQFNNQGTPLDFIYYSLVTMATIGYGDIVPIKPLAKITAMAQIGIGIWFFVTVIPVAIADQAERMKLWRTRQEKFARMLKEKIESGELPAPIILEKPPTRLSRFNPFKRSKKAQPEPPAT